MKFLVLSREKIEEAQITEKHIVISIRDPYTAKARLPKSIYRLKTLYLEFSDIDKHFPNTSCILFNSRIAQKILNLVDKYKNKVEVIVCQCEAGISRSAGVAAALSRIINQDDYIYFKRFIPNRTVYRTILEEYVKNYKKTIENE